MQKSCNISSNTAVTRTLYFAWLCPALYCAEN